MSLILTEHSEIFLTEIAVTVMRIALLSMEKMNRVAAINEHHSQRGKENSTGHVYKICADPFQQVRCTRAVRKVTNQLNILRTGRVALM
jgi:hypothetical protein